MASKIDRYSERSIHKLQRAIWELPPGTSMEGTVTPIIYRIDQHNKAKAISEVIVRSSSSDMSYLNYCAAACLAVILRFDATSSVAHPCLTMRLPELHTGEIKACCCSLAVSLAYLYHTEGLPFLLDWWYSPPFTNLKRAIVGIRYTSIADIAQEGDIDDIDLKRFHQATKGIIQRAQEMANCTIRI